jgi:hypothetical protein
MDENPMYGLCLKVIEKSEKYNSLCSMLKRGSVGESLDSFSSEWERMV